MSGRAGNCFPCLCVTFRSTGMISALAGGGNPSNSSRLRLRVVVESFFIVARAGLLTLEISKALVRLFVLLGWCSMSTETLSMKGLLWQWAPRTKHGSRYTFEVRIQCLFDLFVFSISFEVGTRVLWCWLEDFAPNIWQRTRVRHGRSLTTASVDLYSWVSYDPVSMAANTIAANSLGSRTKGLLRELNPGPLAPEARIIPLDQAADGC